MQLVAPSSTDVSVTIRIVDSTTFLPEEGVTSASGGLALWYRKGQAGAVTAITESDLGATTSSHSDGGMIHLDDGYYRLDLPDAAIPTSEFEYTVIGGTVTGMLVLGAALMGKPAELTQTNIRSAVGLSSANLDAQLAAIDDFLDTEVAAIIGYIDTEVASILAAVDTEIGAIQADITTLLGRLSAARAGYLDALAGWTGTIRQALRALASGAATEASSDLTGGDSTYDNATDSQESIRNRGDSAWITAVGFSTHSAADVWAVATRTLSAFSFSVTVGTNNDKAGYSLSAAGVQAIWDALTSALTTAGSIGKLIVDNLNATISSRSSHSAADVWTSGTRTLTAFGFSVTVGTNNDKTGYTLSAPGVQAIWDALTSALTTNGSIGKLIVDNLNATISSIASTLSGISARLPAALTGDGNIKADTLMIEGVDATQQLAAGSSGLDLIRNDTAQAGGASSITLDASASATDDLYNGAVIVIVSGTGAGQSRTITDYVGSTKVATVDRVWAINPASDSVFAIFSSDGRETGSAIGAGAISWTVQILDGNSDPVDGAEVWVTLGEDPTTDVVAGTLTTDAAGECTFLLDAGTYWVHAQKSGVNFDSTETTVA